MSYSLQVVNGDLSVQAGQVSVVTGSSKLLQDLTLWVLTKMGSDPYNIGYGSLIDGGTQPNGTVVSSPIGTHQWTSTQALIQQDITRIITTYQSQQNARMQADAQAYNKQTLTQDEILTGMTGITFSNDITLLTATVYITNASNNQLQITVPLQGGIGD